ncbi:MAG: hypothetical protein MZV70_58925 [Desulfobacterales bacterium]|nr:hypothetical protein [Desulfobacterales bacterium]
MPLIHSASVRCGNALRMDWNTVISAEEVDYILGNPPFVGAKYMSDAQALPDMTNVFRGVRNAGLLDYVTAWYLKAVRYIRGDEKVSGLLDSLLRHARSRHVSG